jgi:hypothetical protein
MGRRRRSSVVPFVVLGAAVSLGVVALTASRFGWRRTKAETTEEQPPPETRPAPEPGFVPARPVPAARWDATPEEYAAARASGDPPAPEPLQPGVSDPIPV